MIQQQYQINSFQGVFTNAPQRIKKSPKKQTKTINSKKCESSTGGQKTGAKFLSPLGLTWAHFIHMHAHLHRHTHADICLIKQTHLHMHRLKPFKHKGILSEADPHEVLCQNPEAMR